MFLFNNHFYPPDSPPVTFEAVRYINCVIIIIYFQHSICDFSELDLLSSSTMFTVVVALQSLRTLVGISMLHEDILFYCILCSFLVMLY